MTLEECAADVLGQRCAVAAADATAEHGEPAGHHSGADNDERATAWPPGQPACRIAEDRPPRLAPGTAPDLRAMVDRIPPTDDGNVDRTAVPDRAAPAPAERRPNRRKRAMLSARDNMRSRVTALFAETSGCPHPHPDENFFAVGGESLGAIRLISLLGREFDVALRLRDFMLSPTPAGLSRLLEKAVEEATQQARMKQ